LVLAAILIFLGIKLRNDYETFEKSRGMLLSGMSVALAIGVFAVLFYPSYYLNLGNAFPGISRVTGPNTQVFHAAVVWGGFFVFFIPFGLLQIRDLIADGLLQRRCHPGGVVRFGFLVAFIIAIMSLGTWFGLDLKLALGLTILFSLIWRGFQTRGPGPPTHLQLTLGLTGLSLLLVIGPDLFHVTDAGGNRMNTVFKLYYQSWVILSIATPVVLYYGFSLVHHYSSWIRTCSRLWIGFLALVFLNSVYYTVGAGWDKTLGFSQSPTLDGLAHVKLSQPGEYAAILWLRSTSEPGERILEAPGDSYSEFGRVSAATGMPTILGWVGHEHQWRGDYDYLQDRLSHVDSLYRGKDPTVSKELLARYSIDYIVVGPRERSLYGVHSLSSLEGALEQVFAYDDTIIYGLKEPNDTTK